MNLEIIGIIERLGKTLPVASNEGQRTFYKRELLLDCTTYDRYSGRPYENHIPFEFYGDKCNILDSFKEGNIVGISFNVHGVKYKDTNTNEEKYFVKVRGYDCRLVRESKDSKDAAAPQAAQSAPQPSNPPVASFPPPVDSQGNIVNQNDDEQLPF